MDKYFFFTLKQLIFWLVYFLILQGVFLLFFNNELKDVSLSHTLLSFKSGFWLNLSAAAYCTIPLVIAVFIAGLRKSKGQKTLLVITTVLLFCCFLINTTDMALYHNWGTRINGKALWYLQFPGTVSTSAGSLGHIKFVITVLVISIAAWFLYKKYLFKIPEFKKQHLQLSLTFLLITGLLFVTLRGGISGRPISKGESYYSKYPVLNYAAINGFWNFFDIISHYKSQGNPYHFYSQTELNNLEKHLANQNSGTDSKLTDLEKPNILFVFLESWGADVVGCLGGQPNVTPGFDLLAKDGLLFTNFYSTGFRTEQGLMAVFSGFPAQAQTYPMMDMERFENYPNLISQLSNQGYYTSYFTGGNPRFANTDMFLQSAGIDKINKELLAKAKRKSAWGAMDEETFDWVLGSLNSQPKPFFSSMVTLTSHEWFEAPVKKIFSEKDFVAEKYKNTVHYTDSCLHDFIGKAKKQKWYNNTLIVIMADHACSYPLARSINEPGRYHIPMLITGGALKKEFIGTINSNFGGHLNIPAMICDELNIQKNKFKLSFNFLSANTAAFAYYTYDHGVGVLAKKDLVVYDMNLKDIILTKQKNMKSAYIDSLLGYGKYIMQTAAQMKEDFQTMK